MADGKEDIQLIGFREGRMQRIRVPYLPPCSVGRSHQVRRGEAAWNPRSGTARCRRLSRPPGRRSESFLCCSTRQPARGTKPPSQEHLEHCDRQGMDALQESCLRWKVNKTAAAGCLKIPSGAEQRSPPGAKMKLLESFWDAFGSN